MDLASLAGVEGTKEVAMPERLMKLGASLNVDRRKGRG